MTLQQYIEALSALPEAWKAAPRETVPIAFLGETMVAAHGCEFCGYDPADETWKDPSLIGRLAA